MLMPMREDQSLSIDSFSSFIFLGLTLYNLRDLHSVRGPPQDRGQKAGTLSFTPDTPEHCLGPGICSGKACWMCERAGERTREGVRHATPHAFTQHGGERRCMAQPAGPACACVWLSAPGVAPACLQIQPSSSMGEHVWVLPQLPWTGFTSLGASDPEQGFGTWERGLGDGGGICRSQPSHILECFFATYLLLGFLFLLKWSVEGRRMSREVWPYLEGLCWNGLPALTTFPSLVHKYAHLKKRAAAHHMFHVH